MKNIFLTLILTFAVLISFAQGKSDSSKHLSFKGIPIDGKLSDYIAKMKKGGFTHKGTYDGVAILEGEFASYKKCLVGVSTMKQKDLVNMIAVMFPDRDNWSSLSSNYFNLKELLTEKYGEPSESVEEFQSYTPDDDGTKMTLVQLGSCKYITNFETDKGTIQLSIEHADLSRCFVKLAYFDKLNGQTVKKKALDDL
jgi:hypothetical protein